MECNKCIDTSKRETTLKKHIITKHEDHICKECYRNLLTFTDLMKQIAEHHCSEVKGIDMKDPNKSKVDKKKGATFGYRKDNKRKKSFVFSESILDEFIQ